MQHPGLGGGMGGSVGDDDALESFLDSYLTNSFGAAGNNAYGVGQHQQQQQPQPVQQQLFAGSLGGGQPTLGLGLLNRPASLGLPQASLTTSGLGSMGLSVPEDTSNLNIPALQALLRQRQMQQQHQGFGVSSASAIGQLGGVGGGSNIGLLRPTSLQDHLTGGLSSEHNTWRPSLGPLPSNAGVQYGEPNMGNFPEQGFSSVLAPPQILRPASDSLLINQRSAVATPVNVQGHGLSTLRTNSLSAQTAATAGLHAAGVKKTWDAGPPVAEGSDDSSEDDSSQRRRVKGRSTSTSHQPSVQQEKNRSAQRRFRQRQKEKMAYLENRTEALSSQVEKLSQDNESLRNMNTMLEKVLNLREEHISNLQEAAKVFSNLNLRGDGDGGGDGSCGVGGGGGDAAHKAMQDAVNAAAGASSGGPGGGPGGVIKTEDGGVMAPLGGAGAAGGGMAASAASLMDGDTAMASSPIGLLGGGGHVLPLNIDGATARFTAEAIRSMTADDVIEAWKENLKELSRYVVLAENAPPGQPLPASVLARITSTTASMSELVHKVAMISPLNVKRLLATNMELHAMVAVPEQHWARVLLVLGLSERQRKDLLGARERFLTKFDATVQERAALINSLSQQALPRNRVYADICSASLAAHEAADRLRANLQREHNINMEFVVFVFRGVLDLMQIAKAAVHSYPYYPDVLAMANVLHAQQPQQQSQSQGQSQQQQLMPVQVPVQVPPAPQSQGSQSQGAPSQSQAQSSPQQPQPGTQQQQQQQQQMLAAAVAQAQMQQQVQMQLQQQQQQQQQQQMLAGMSSLGGAAGGGMGGGVGGAGCSSSSTSGLRTTGSAPIGAAVLFGSRVPSVTTMGGGGGPQPLMGAGSGPVGVPGGMGSLMGALGAGGGGGMGGMGMLGGMKAGGGLDRMGGMGLGGVLGGSMGGEGMGGGGGMGGGMGGGVMGGGAGGMMDVLMQQQQQQQQDSRMTDT